MGYKLIVACTLIICILPAVPSPYRSRSKSRSSSPTYDQKQTGDYNIQLHLKDFQVVALVSDSALGDLGDYDYSYDYSDLTVKPSTTTTTTPRTPSTTPRELSTTTASHPSTTAGTSSHPATATSATTKTTSKADVTTRAPATEPKTTTPKPPATTTTEKKIHVEVLMSTRLDAKPEEPPAKDHKAQDVIQIDGNFLKPSDIVSSVNKEETNQTEMLSNGSYRKCATGFSRDKQGRCRRVRRPVSQFPFGITRLATLASKLRQATGDQPAANIE